MQKQEYKNSSLTKKKIASAYLSLMAIKPDEINVTEIVKASKINRGTFYLHFENVKAVEKYIELELYEKFKIFEQEFRQVEIDKTPEIIILKLNEILLNDLDFYRLFVTATNEIRLMDIIKRAILISIANNFRIMKYVSNYEHFKIVVQYIVGGAIHVYANWFKGNIDCSINELAENLTSLIKNGLRDYIKDGN